MANNHINRTGTRDSHLPSYTRGKKQIITPELVDGVLSDYWGSILSKQNIAKKYNIGVNTVYRWAKENKHLIDKYLKDPPVPVNQRFNLPEIQRVELITKDAYTVLEKTLEVINARLEGELMAIKEGIKVPFPVKMNELSVVIAEITPYLMEKKSAPKGKSSISKDIADKKGLVKTMFKQAN